LSTRYRLVVAGILLGLLIPMGTAAGQSLFSGNEARPSDAIILFVGKDLGEWVYAKNGKPAKWRVEHGYMEVRGGNICTKREFTDFQAHVEFRLPLMPEATGQKRANSGVYLQGKYEIQVLDSYGLNSGDSDCGAIYKVAPPLVNACRPPELWQSYDAIFHAPRFDDKGNQISKARITAFQNGVLIQDNVEVPGPTVAAMTGPVTDHGPLMLQDHGCPVRYRNVWIRPLSPAR